MAVFQKTHSIETHGKGLIALDNLVMQAVAESRAETGLANVFLHHTSASLTLMENADPTAMHDLEAFMANLVPEDLDYFRHTAEGPDDMPSHIRSVLTTNSISMPIADGKLISGTWQGIFLWEHRQQPHRRRLTITVTS